MVLISPNNMNKRYKVKNYQESLHLSDGASERASEFAIVWAVTRSFRFAYML